MKKTLKGYNNMEKTAVEWLEEKWNKYDLNLGKSGFSLLLKQALQMEKEQIIEAYKYGNQSDVYFKPEQYYNETYKSE